MLGLALCAGAWIPAGVAANAVPDGYRVAHESRRIIFYAPEAQRTAGKNLGAGIDFDSIGEIGDRTVERIATNMGIPHGDPLTVFLAPAHASERAKLPLPPIPDWAAGVAYGASGQIVVVVNRPRSYPDASLGGLLAHEVAHVMFDRALAETPHSAPRWFEEGFAVLEARPWGWRDAIALGTAILPENPPPLATLERTFPRDAGSARVAYAISVSFVSYLEQQAGEGAVRRIALRMREGDEFEKAVLRVTGVDLRTLEKDWRSGSAWSYRWIPLITSSATVWFVALALLFVAAAKKRARRRALERHWEQTGYGDRDFDPGGSSGSSSSGSPHDPNGNGQSGPVS